MIVKLEKLIRQIIVLIICVIITGLGVSLAIKASLGIGAFDAAAMSISKLLAIKVGSIAMSINISFVLLQIIILKRKFKPLQFLQIGISILLGTMINLFLYNLLDRIEISNYILRLLMLLFGYTICAIAISIIMSINLVSMPLEGFCLVLSKKINIKFGRLRQYVDVVSICIVLAITLLFRVDLTLREGTIIGMLIFGPMLDISMNIFKPKLSKLNLI